MTKSKMTDVAEQMRELGYGDVDEALVESVLEWHRANPLPHNAALAANILGALEKSGVPIVPQPR